MTNQMKETSAVIVMTLPVLMNRETEESVFVIENQNIDDE